MNLVARALLRIVKRVGRWLIKRLLRRGHGKVLAFIELRIDTFRDRLDRARTKGRKRLLRARIRWRVRLLTWLRRNQRSHTKTVLKNVDKAVTALGRKVPWVHKAERMAA